MTSTNEAPRRPFGTALMQGTMHLLGRALLRQFRAKAWRAEQVNQATLQKILRMQQDTRFGRAHGFSAVRDLAAFQQAVPLSTYDTYAEQVAAMLAGQTNLLCRDPIAYFSLSSGTTGRPKYVPTTAAQQRRVAMMMSAVPGAVLDDQLPHTGGRSVFLASASATPTRSPAGIPIGSASAGGLRRMSWMAPYLWTAPWPVFTVADPAVSAYLQALYALSDPALDSITGIFAPHVLGWLDVLAARWEALLNDLRHGTLDGAGPLAAELKAALKPPPASPARAQALVAAARPGWEGFLPRAWPQLRAVVATVSGGFAVYQPRLAHWLGDRPIYSAMYGASEALLGVNLSLADPNRYTLAAGQAVFEFVREADLDREQPPALAPSQVELGQRYEIVVTNFSGFYRYRLRDVVEVVDRLGEAPVLAFRYRHGTLLNLAGEKTTEAQTHDAVQALVQRYCPAARLLDYTTWGDDESTPPGYVVYVALDRPPAADTLAQGAQLLDAALGDANEEYRSFYRARARLSPPELVLVAPEGFHALERWLIDRAQGLNRNQVKIPRRITDRAARALLDRHVLARSGQAGRASV